MKRYLSLWWALADPVSNYLAKAGATLICNLSASDEVIGKDSYRRQLVSNQSARLVAGYIYCSAGDGESTQDMVFSGHNIIAENGSILAESRLFENGITISEIDFKKLAFERRKISTYPASAEWDYSSKDSGFLNMENISRERFSFEIGETALTRKFAKNAFYPVKSGGEKRVLSPYFANAVPWTYEAYRTHTFQDCGHWHFRGT